MAEQKTKPTAVDVQEFLARVEDEQKRADCRTLVELMREATGEPPVMWGPSMVGFGCYHYRYASGHQGEAFLTGFAPRARNLTLYVMDGFEGYDALLARLGKHSTGKSCLYLKGLGGVDLDALRQLILASVQHVRAMYPAA